MFARLYSFIPNKIYQKLKHFERKKITNIFLKNIYIRPLFPDISIGVSYKLSDKLNITKLADKVTYIQNYPSYIC